MKKADLEDGDKPATSGTQSTELREAKKRIRLLEQENDSPARPAAAYFSQAHLPRK